jgi:hypothetical protein
LTPSSSIGASSRSATGGSSAAIGSQNAPKPSKPLGRRSRAPPGQSFTRVGGSVVLVSSFTLYSRRRALGCLGVSRIDLARLVPTPGSPDEPRHASRLALIQRRSAAAVRPKGPGRPGRPEAVSGTLRAGRCIPSRWADPSAARPSAWYSRSIGRLRRASGPGAARGPRTHRSDDALAPTAGRGPIPLRINPPTRNAEFRRDRRERLQDRNLIAAVIYDRADKARKPV